MRSAAVRKDLSGTGGEATSSCRPGVRDLQLEIWKHTLHSAEKEKL